MLAARYGPQVLLGNMISRKGWSEMTMQKRVTGLWEMNVTL